MAASGYTPISLYYSTTASAVPTAGNLANGELALNIADMKLYAKNSSGVVTLLASNASTTGVDSLSFGSTGLTPSTATTGAITVAGTLNVANGGTGLTSLTANRIPYGNGTSALQSSSALTFDGTNLSASNSIYVGSGSTSATFTRYWNTSGYSYVGVEGSAGGAIATGTAPYAAVLASSGTNKLQFAPNGTLAATFDNSGNFGIGTSSPTQKLEVTGNILISTSGNPSMTVKTTGAGNNPWYRLQADTNYWDMLSVFSDTNDTLRFRYNSSDWLTLTNDGNVRVGWSSTTLGWYYDTNYSMGLQCNTATRTLYIDNQSSDSGSAIVFRNTTNGTLSEKARITAAGAWSFGSSGTNTGTSGQVLTSQGSGSAPTWSTAGGGTTMLFCAFSSTMGL